MTVAYSYVFLTDDYTEQGYVDCTEQWEGDYSGDVGTTCSNCTVASELTFNMTNDCGWDDVEEVVSN
jgi:hypothetical protein